jgi:ribose 1,5-bisphosphokinase PhnN
VTLKRQTDRQRNKCAVRRIITRDRQDDGDDADDVKKIVIIDIE